MIVARHRLENGSFVEFETHEEHDRYLKNNTAQPTAKEISERQIMAYVDKLDIFCADFVKKMKVENIGLGIGQAPTTVVKSITELTAAALKSVENGSLRVAIKQIAEIPAESLDGHFLTPERLKAKRNELEIFLNILPLSKNYDD